MPPVIRETSQALYVFFRRFTWELYKSIMFRVKEYDIELQGRGWSLWRRVLLWAAIGAVVLALLLLVLRLVANMFLTVISPVSESVEQLQ